MTGIQLGPQGMTSDSNPSPYDGTVFSKSTLSLDLAALVEGPAAAASGRNLLSARTWEALRKGVPAGPRDRVPYRYVFGALRGALREMHQTLHARRNAGDANASAIVSELERFSEKNAAWLERDALHAALSAEHAGAHWSAWPEGDRHLFNPRSADESAKATARRAELARTRAEDLERYALGQLLVHAQHAALREALGPLGLKLYGDLQVGLSSQDRWSYGGLFLPGYFLGAPPSRTNPEGQAWSYPVLDPARFFAADGSRGPAMELVAARMGKLLAEFDGIRIDHPHGLVCPWVYRADGDDVLRAVQGGARLFDSPDLPDHPALAAFAIPSRAQLTKDPSTPRYADGWVAELTDAQVERYSVQLDVVIEAMRKNGRDPHDLVCEVLSTLPYPLQRVLQRHGLGRFRVTQKADLGNPADVYRSENAEPADWMMVGNHDTAPIWTLVETWVAKGTARDQAAYLAQRLAKEPDRAAFASKLAQDPGLLVTAKFADLFASRARNVMVFFADWFGLTDVYNAPGTISPDNWSLRLPASWEQDYAKRLAGGRALNLPAALAMALRAPGAVGGAVEGETPASLAEALDRLARSSASQGRESR